MAPTILLVVLISSLAYILGGSLVLFQKNWSEKTLLSLIALSAGLLLSITLLDLIPEGQEGIQNSGLFIMLGFLVMYLIFLPPLSNGKAENPDTAAVKGLTIGMLLHNFFEGLSIGISYSASFKLGFLVTIALVIHKIPEGLSYTSAMLAFLNGRRKTAIYLVVQGLFTWFGAGAAVFLTELDSVQEKMIAIGLSITAGIFLFLSGTLLLPLINRGTFKSTPFYFLGGIILYIFLHSIA